LGLVSPMTGASLGGCTAYGTEYIASFDIYVVDVVCNEVEEGQIRDNMVTKHDLLKETIVLWKLRPSDEDLQLLTRTFRDRQLSPRRT
jgi:hypothetical protein